MSNKITGYKLNYIEAIIEPEEMDLLKNKILTYSDMFQVCRTIKNFDVNSIFGRLIGRATNKQIKMMVFEFYNMHITKIFNNSYLSKIVVKKEQRREI